MGLAAGLGGGFINAAELLGYVSFDVAVAEACAVKVEEVVSGTACEVLPADMGAYLGDMAACAGLITPLQGEGDPCGLRFEGAYTTLPDGCIEGLVCEGEGDVMPTCEQGIAPGGDCSAEGAQCGGAVCVDGVCTVQGAVDAPCTSGSECASGNCIGGACGLPDPICPPSVVDAGEAG